MYTRLRTTFPPLWIGALAALLSCSSPPGGEQLDPTAVAQERVVNGTPASAYPEAALVDLYMAGRLNAYCSGSVIAPQVVLTAGHCVKGETFSGVNPDSWVVTVPYNGMQTAKASNADVFDWTDTSGTIDPSLHDIGLIFLDTPIQMAPSQCPVLAQKELANGSNVVRIGRVLNGAASTTDVFISSPVAVADGTSAGYPNDYTEQGGILESGDSGGPSEVAGMTPHQIVAVNSGGGSPEVLARIDQTALYQWIQQQITAHGGGCNGQSADGGGADAAADASAGEAGMLDASAGEAGTLDASVVDAPAFDAAQDAASAVQSPPDGASGVTSPTSAHDAGGVGAAEASPQIGNVDAGPAAQNQSASTDESSSVGGCSCRVAERAERGRSPWGLEFLGGFVVVVVASRHRSRSRP
jgi:hypothetical protein